MKSIFHYFAVISIIFLVAGCNEVKVAGFYYSERGDALQIKKNGDVLWSPLSKTTEDFGPMGILQLDEKNMEAILIMSSNDPLFGSKLSFSDDLKTITMEWSPYGAEKAKYRGTTYTKRK